MKRSVIITGGYIDTEFVLALLKEEKFDCVIGADHGIDFLKKAGIMPDYIVGDFDSTAPGALEYFYQTNVEIRKFHPEKDDTDTRIALELAIEIGSTSISILGGTGTRMDHVLGNIQNLTLPMRLGIDCYLIDSHNRIRMINHRTVLKKEEQFGQYVSLLANTTEVTGLTLEGFYYPLEGYTLTGGRALGISNEIIEEQAVISLESGDLIVIESRD